MNYFSPESLLPGKRYYGGCEFIDQIEQLAIDRAKQLFDAAYANVQPHSGSQANFAVFSALLKPGDTILSLDLYHGGHLTHGSPVNLSGQLFCTVHYGVNPETEMLDYQQIRELAHQHKPQLIICGYTAYPRQIDFKQFRSIANEVNAYLLADMSHIAGLVATGYHPSPVAYCDVVTTTTHKTLRGPRGGLILSRDPELGKQLDRAVFPGTQGGPLEHIIAAKAIAFAEALQPEFKDYIRQVVVNAQVLADRLQAQGIRIVSGGTDNHLLLIDLRPLKLTGKQADRLLSNINITVNKNTIPFDIQLPWVTSGIRLGSPALTTRGMSSIEFAEIGEIISLSLLNPSDLAIAQQCRQRIAQLCEAFPLYPHLNQKPLFLASGAC